MNIHSIDFNKIEELSTEEKIDRLITNQNVLATEVRQLAIELREGFAAILSGLEAKDDD